MDRSLTGKATVLAEPGPLEHGDATPAVWFTGVSGAYKARLRHDHLVGGEKGQVKA